jgi:6-phosphogluconolactonase
MEARMVPSSSNAFRRRIIGFVFLLLSALLGSPGAVRGEEYILYVGTYTGAESKGIYAFRFNPATGEAHPAGLASSTVNPSFLAVDPKGRFLYAVNEVDTFQNNPAGAVSVFAIDRETAALKPLQQVSSLGSGPAHLSLDRSGKFLMVANYTGGSFGVFPVGADGRLSSRTAFVQQHGAGPDPRRQAGPHAHCILTSVDNRLAVVADLGLDKLLAYRFDASTGSLSPARPPFYTMDPGSGPRHIAFTPSGKYLYAVNELTSTVTVFAYDGKTGSLRMGKTISTLPKDFLGRNSTAEIAVEPKGKFLYVSNRGHNTIAVFRIEPKDGSLKEVEWIPSGGKTPRNFAIDPTGKWLFAANQGSNEIALFRLDPGSGHLTPAGPPLSVVSPVCVAIVRSN